MKMFSLHIDQRWHNMLDVKFNDGEAERYFMGDHPRASHGRSDKIGFYEKHAPDFTTVCVGGGVDG
jgi:hypothetical protein